MADPVQLASFQDLVQFFGTQKRAIEHDPNESALAIATAEPDLGRGKVIVRWDQEAPMLHIIQPMIDGVPGEHADAICRAICRINNPAKLAGLGYDENTRIIYFRFSIVRLKDGVRSDLVLNLSRAVTQSAKELLPAMRAVAGGASADEAAKLAGV
jgi:hypothetical protein